ncbi:MAG: energy-coupled thiamine transporter ThiT [Clostridia bacterium]|nr:energy-coupled thiamine transporter ThiT [Clostridia bacterium]
MLNWLLCSALAEGTAAAEEAKKPFIEWFADPFSKLAKAGVWEWLTFAALVVLGALLLYLSRSKVKWTTRMLAHAAMALALSFVLSYIRFFRMAGGGAVTPGSMLPVMLFGAAYGLVPGLLVGFAYSLLQIVQGAEAAGFMGLLLDYILAFSALGLAGLAKKWPRTWGLYAAMIIALTGRLVCSILSGVIVWGTPLWGSITYNCSYMLPEMVICLLLGMLIGPRIVSMMRKQ